MRYKTRKCCLDCGAFYNQATEDADPKGPVESAFLEVPLTLYLHFDYEVFDPQLTHDDLRQPAAPAFTGKVFEGSGNVDISAPNLDAWTDAKRLAYLLAEFDPCSYTQSAARSNEFWNFDGGKRVGYTESATDFSVEINYMPELFDSLFSAPIELQQNPQGVDRDRADFEAGGAFPCVWDFPAGSQHLERSDYPAQTLTATNPHSHASIYAGIGNGFTAGSQTWNPQFSVAGHESYADACLWAGGTAKDAELPAAVGSAVPSTDEAVGYYQDNVHDPATNKEANYESRLLDCNAACVPSPGCGCDDTYTGDSSYGAAQSQAFVTIAATAGTQYLHAFLQLGTSNDTLDGSDWDPDPGTEGVGMLLRLESHVLRAVQGTSRFWEREDGTPVEHTGTDCFPTLVYDHVPAVSTQTDTDILTTQIECLLSIALTLRAEAEPTLPVYFETLFEGDSPNARQQEPIDIPYTENPVTQNPASPSDPSFRNVSVDLQVSTEAIDADGSAWANSFEWRHWNSENASYFVTHHADHDPTNGKYVIAFPVKPIRSRLDLAPFPVEPFPFKQNLSQGTGDRYFAFDTPRPVGEQMDNGPEYYYKCQAEEATTNCSCCYTMDDANLAASIQKTNDNVHRFGCVGLHIKSVKITPNPTP